MLHRRPQSHIMILKYHKQKKNSQAVYYVNIANYNCVIVFQQRVT